MILIYMRADVMRVLLVEDNADLAESVGDYLGKQRHLCDFAYNGQAGLHAALNNQYDIYIFDVAMPKMDGITLCQTLRNEHRDQTPVLFLTARDTLEDKLNGFSAGADDYLVKPFELKELEARIQAIRKRQLGQESILKLHDLVVNLDTEEVVRAGNLISLGPNNYKLLVALLQRSPALVPRKELEYLVWGEDLPDSDTLRSNIYKLRGAVDKPYDRALIQTIKGRGFRIS